MSHPITLDLSAAAAYARAQLRSLEQIESDRQLMRSGYRLIFAVDFTEIMRFLQPGALAQSGTPTVPGGPEEQEHLRQQLALRFVLGRLGHDVLILPPHQIELSDHFHLRRSLYAPPHASDALRLEEHLAKSLTDQKSFRALAALLEKEPGSPLLLPAQMKKLTKFLREHFRELLFVLSSGPGQEADAHEPVRHILRRHGLRSFTEYFDDPALQFDAVFSAAEAWFDRLDGGTHPGGAGAAYTDGLVCAYLERTNALLNPKKEALLLVSNSTPVADALADRVRVEGGPACSTSVVRDLNYFYVLLQHARRDEVGMSADLRRSWMHFDRANRVIGDALHPGDGGLPASFERAAGELLGGLLRTLGERENLGLAIGAAAVLMRQGEGSSIGNLTPRLSAGMRAVSRLASGDAEVLLRLRDELGRVDAVAARQLSDLDVLVNTGRPPDGRAHAVRLQGAPGEERVVLESLAPDMPTEVAFDSPVVSALASGLAPNGSGRPSDSAWQDFLLDLARACATDPEIHTLRAYRFASMGNRSSALGEVSLALEAERLSTPARIELLHLRTVLHRLEEETDEALLSCVGGLALNELDPRLNHELAILLWQVLRTHDPVGRTRLSELVKDLVGQDPDYVMALGYIGRAHCTLERGAAERNGRSSLMAHVLNSYARLALEFFRVRRDIVYLTLAEEKMSELRELLPEKSWVTKFYHTMGSVLFERWDLSRDDIGELRAAKKYLLETMGNGEMPLSEKAIYEEDLAQVSALLRKLGYSDRADSRPLVRENFA